MKLTGAYTIPAPREKVFAMITDPAVLQRVIDGCEKMVKTGEHSYNAHLNLRWGPGNTLRRTRNQIHGR